MKRGITLITLISHLVIAGAAILLTLLVASRFFQGSDIDQTILTKDTAMYLNTVTSLQGNLILNFPSRLQSKLMLVNNSVVTTPLEIKKLGKSYPYWNDSYHKIIGPEDFITPYNLGLNKNSKIINLNNNIQQNLINRNCPTHNTKKPFNQVKIQVYFDKGLDEQANTLVNSLKPSFENTKMGEDGDINFVIKQVDKIQLNPESKNIKDLSKLACLLESNSDFSFSYSNTKKEIIILPSKINVINVEKALEEFYE